MLAEIDYTARECNIMFSLQRYSSNKNKNITIYLQIQPVAVERLLSGSSEQGLRLNWCHPEPAVGLPRKGMSAAGPDMPTENMCCPWRVQVLLEK